MKKLYFITILFIFPLLILLSICLASAEHLIFSRITITPTNAEFVSIFNPTEDDINLSDYYITDSVIDDNLYLLILFIKNLINNYYTYIQNYYY